MKKRFVKGMTATALSGMLVFGMGSVASAAEYPDVNPGDWYYEYVQDVSDKGLMSGYTDTGKFGPSDQLTRGQFATILWRMEGSPEVAYNGQFPDVSGNEFYGSAVAWASENGIITGYTNSGKFGAEDHINREQMATILYRYDGSPAVDQGGVYNFPDGNSVNEFALNGVAYAAVNGIIKGDNGYIKPQGNVIRAECATMISRFSSQETPDQNQGQEEPEHVHDFSTPVVEEQDVWVDTSGYVQKEIMRCSTCDIDLTGIDDAQHIKEHALAGEGTGGWYSDVIKVWEESGHWETQEVITGYQCSCGEIQAK